MRIEEHPNQSFRRILHLLARPLKGKPGGAGLVIQPYRGIGFDKKVFLMGRVFNQPGGSAGVEKGTIRREMVDVARRVMRKGVGYAILKASFGGAVQRVNADRNGYFRSLFKLDDPLPPHLFWHRMGLELLWPSAPHIATEGVFFVPPPSARYVVISDIDDTVVYTGVANKVMMMWRMFFQKPHSRTAFPGVAAFYRALYRGRSGEEMNPLLYVSRGPWALYEVLDAFFNLHQIPVGPILFLREWGLTLQKPFPPPSKGHKLQMIRRMLKLFDKHPFILIGDSGQRDPEIYSQVVQENPGRVLAIYIRNIRKNPRRSRAIEELARRVVDGGSRLVVAPDTVAMALHAVGEGFIKPQDLREIRGEMLQDATAGTAYA